MRLITARILDQAVPMLLRDDGGLVDLRPWGLHSLLELVQADLSVQARIAESAPNSEPSAIFGGVPLEAPIPVPPRNVFCVGANYRSHIEEGDRGPDQGPPPAPVFFTKPWTTLRGSGQVLEFPKQVALELDWEAEIACVIGRGGRNLSEDDAAQAVFGLTLANDLSARDIQLRNGNWGQWFQGKSLDGSCPMGPVLVTLDEFGGQIPDLEFRLTLNGVEKQSARMSEMVHGIPGILASLSVGLELLPGDVVLTGTPAGVGHWHDPKQFLADGDEVIIECPEIGQLSNVIRHV